MTSESKTDAHLSSTDTPASTIQNVWSKHYTYELSIDEFVELLLDSFEVVVEGSDLLGAQLKACGLVPTAIQRLESHQYYWLVGF